MLPLNEVDKLNEDLQLLVGGELESVTFIRDYLQLNFYQVGGSALHLSFMVFPVIETPDGSYEIQEVNYRNLLCSLIDSTIEKISCSSSELKLVFANNFALSLLWENGDGGELLHFQWKDKDGNSHYYYL